MRLSVVVGLVLAALLAPAHAQASAKPDAVGPRITVSESPSFLIGQSFSDPVDVDGELFFWNGGGWFEYRWTASDRSGICRHSVDVEDMVDNLTEGVQDVYTNSTADSYGWNEDGYFNSDDMYMAHINVWDCAGNRSTVARRHARPRMVVDYGATVPRRWARTYCECAMGDSMLRTKKKGASLTASVSAGEYSKHFALIMAKGPARGKAAIYLDGTRVKTVDTYAPENSNRIVIWDVELSGSAGHEIKVVNLATPGRARIDVDAYVQN